MTLIRLSLLYLTMSYMVLAQSLTATINQERDPGKRSELALSMADESFDQARDFYDKGIVDKGDAALEDMTMALNACVQSLAISNKIKFYKHAEMKVAFLQRRMTNLLSDLSVSERGWAEQTKRRLEEIHDKLIQGVMRK